MEKHKEENRLVFTVEQSINVAKQNRRSSWDILLAKNQCKNTEDARSSSASASRAKK